MKILVIIVSYNFERWIERCLGSLRQSEYPVDVMVIDNASQDNTIKRIKTDYPEVRLVENPCNQGFGKANNIGIKIALDENYDAVFLLNQDAWIDNKTIGTLIELSKKYPEYGILSPVHLTGSGQKLDFGFSQYAGISDTTIPQKEQDIVPLPFINAAFWMIPTSVLKQVGGFSPLFYHYGEDKDFVNRLHYHRYQLGYSPTVFGNHDREKRPISYQGFLRSEYVYHLSEYANINHSFCISFARGILAPLKKAILHLLKWDLRLSKDYVKMGFQLLMKSKNIYGYRKINTTSNPHYI